MTQPLLCKIFNTELVVKDTPVFPTETPENGIVSSARYSTFNFEAPLLASVQFNTYLSFHLLNISLYNTQVSQKA